MIRRIVHMRFKEEEVGNFLALFEKQSPLIRASAGCSHLELWRNKAHLSDIYTFSIWESEEALNTYRHSDLFKTTWIATKKLFRDRASADSFEQMIAVEGPKDKS